MLWWCGISEALPLPRELIKIYLDLRSDPSIKDKSHKSPSYVDAVHSVAERLIEAVSDYIGSLPSDQAAKLTRAFLSAVAEEFARRFRDVESPDLSKPLGPELLNAVEEAVLRGVKDGKVRARGVNNMPEAVWFVRLLAAETVIHAATIFLSYVGTVRLA